MFPCTLVTSSSLSSPNRSGSSLLFPLMLLVFVLSCTLLFLSPLAEFINVLLLGHEGSKRAGSNRRLVLFLLVATLRMMLSLPSAKNRSESSLAFPSQLLVFPSLLSLSEVLIQLRLLGAEEFCSSHCLALFFLAIIEPSSGWDMSRLLCLALSGVETVAIAIVSLCAPLHTHQGR